MESFAQILPLAIVLFVVTFAFLKGQPVFENFVTGARKGISTSFKILPTLLGIITAITMLQASGAIEILANITKPVLSSFGFPSELLPLAILRPISGSGANSAVINIFENFGADSKQGMIASVLASSTETTFYAISVYLAGKTYEKLSYIVPIALIGDFFAVIMSVFVIDFFY